MRFLTIFFMLVYGWRLLNKQQNTISLWNRKCANKTGEEIDNEIKTGIKTNNKDVLLLSFIAICSIIIMIIQIFYVLFAFKYSNMTIWIIYVIIMIVNKIINSIKNRVNKKPYYKIWKYTARTFLIHSINLIFFVYMFFILFIF